MGVAAAPPNGFPASLSTVNSILLSAANTSVEEYTSVLHIGDISYAMGFQFYWPLFLDQIQPLASRAIYQLSIGNPCPSFQTSRIMLLDAALSMRSNLTGLHSTSTLSFLHALSSSQEIMSCVGQV
jgi:hypothetical protein